VGPQGSGPAEKNESFKVRMRNERPVLIKKQKVFLIWEKNDRTSLKGGVEVTLFERKER